MPRSLEKAADVLLVLAALMIAVTVVHREWVRSRGPEIPGSVTLPRALPTEVPEWEAMLVDGPGFGPEDAPVKIIVFCDMECPSCARWQRHVFNEYQARHGGVSRYVLMHMPIPAHRFSRMAAVVLECASAQGRFPDVLHLMYANQDSLGLKRWESFAEDGALPDLEAFRACMEGPEPSRIEAGLAWREKLRIGSTPTVLVNEWLFSRPPGVLELEGVVRGILAGEAPAFE